MAQLKMFWYRFDETKKEVKLPDGFTCRRFLNTDEDIEKWLDIVQYGLSHGRADVSYYQTMMVNWKDFKPDQIFMIEKDGEAVATITVICHEDKVGYIHMVACKPECRGKGIGTQMNRIAVNELIDCGMESAYLTTDDFRIPAIKSYLRAGFLPDLSDEDFKRRWAAIFRTI